MLKLFSGKKNKKYDITLVFCPAWHPGFPNVGLGAIDVFLRKYNFKTKVMDLNVLTYKKAPFRKRYLWRDEESYNWLREDLIEKTLQSVKLNLDKLSKIILSYNSPVIGFSVNSANQQVTERISRVIKKKCPEKIIIWGGPNYGNELDPGRPDYSIVNASIVGEGEIPLAELLCLYRDGKLSKKFRNDSICIGTEEKLNQSRVYGAQYVYRNKMYLYKPAQYVVDLNKIPFPDYKGFPIKKYGKLLSFMFTRGCIFKCNFCCDHIRGLKYRYRKPEYIIQEIKHATENLNMRGFVFHDSAINSNMSMLITMCKLLIKNNIIKKWNCLAFPIKTITYDILKLMKDAGCYQLSYGVESGSDRVLKLMGKPFNIKTAENVIRDTNELGMQAKFNIITGFPGETEDDHKDTLNFIKRNRNYIFAIGALNTCDVLAGSILWEKRHTFFTKYDENESSLWEYNGLTLEIRRRRFKEIVDLTRELNIKIEMNNQPDIFNA